MKILFTSLLTFLFFFIASAQNEEALQKVINNSDIPRLNYLADSFANDFMLTRENALIRAKELNIPIKGVTPEGNVWELIRFENGMPLYFTTENENAAKTTSTDKIHPQGGSGFYLTGDSMTAGVWDGGKVRTSHQEFGSRVTQKDNPSTLNDHATHVSGTIAAEGITSTAKGMAFEANLHTYDWLFDASEMSTAAKNGLIISNHSYGSRAGFYYNSDSSRWEWYGDLNVSTKEDYIFGFYTSLPRTWDQIAHAAPYYLIVQAAGNDRNDDGPGAGKTSYYWNGSKWAATTATRNTDGEYDCLLPKACAKNVLTVGAVLDISAGYSIPSDVKMTTFSAWGPTDDGRIKPDIVANGYSLYSTKSSGDKDYYYSSGTSMASPNATGSLVLLQQLYQRLNNNNSMLSSTQKGLVIHTADEAGTADGPDYSFGWGLLNADKAAKVIREDGKTTLIREITLKNKTTYTRKITSNGNEPLKVTIAWNDIPGTSPTASVDPTNKILVNDLDIRVTDSAGTTTYMPWVMDPSNPSKSASTGDNSVDNIEQILIKSPTAGPYTIKVTHKNSLSQSSPQQFSLIVTGLSVVDTTVYCKDTVTYNGDYGMFDDGSLDNNYGNKSDCYFLIQPQNKGRITLFFEEFLTQQGTDVLKVYDGGSTGAKLLGSYSGSTIPDSLTSSGRQLLLHFTTDATVTSTGWKVRYHAINKNSCKDPFMLNYPDANNVDFSFLTRVNRSFTTTIPGYVETGVAFDKFVSVTGTALNPAFPVLLDSLQIQVTHENNSGKKDTVFVYLMRVDSANQPTGDILWEGQYITSQSLSPGGDWIKGTNLIRQLTFFPNIPVTGSFFVGVSYNGPLVDTFAVIHGFENVGSSTQYLATEADYGLALRKYSYYNVGTWFPTAAGFEPEYNDVDNDNIYDRNSNEAAYRQTMRIYPYFTEYYTKTPITITPNGPTEFCEGDEVTLNASVGFINYKWNTGSGAIKIKANTAGSYFVEGIDGNLCVSYSDTVEVTTFTNPPKLNISENGDTLEVPKGYSYQWYYENNPLPGDTLWRVNAQKSGNYFVVVSNANSCSTNSDTLNHFMTGLSPETHKIAVYPNPGTGLFYVKRTHKVENDRIIITDITGKEILRMENPSRDFEINLRGYSSGTYLLQIITPSGIDSKLLKLVE